MADGFTVLPYCPADPVLCKRLEEAGCATVMPLGAPIGSNRGLVTRERLEMIIAAAPPCPWSSTPASALPPTPPRPWSSAPTPCS